MAEVYQEQSFRIPLVTPVEMEVSKLLKKTFYAFLCNTCNTLVNKLLDAEKFQIRIDSRDVRAHLIVSQIGWKDPAFYGMREFTALGTETRQQNQ